MNMPRKSKSAPTKAATLKAVKPKKEEPYNPGALQINGSYMRTEEIEQYQNEPSDALRDKLDRTVMARAMSQPEVRAASVIQAWDSSLDINYLGNELREQVEAVGKGSMSRPEAILTAQAHALDALFCNLSRKAQANSSAGYMKAAEIYLRLALKAQSQCRCTLESLAEIKNPRQVTFLKQSNIAQNQQVNNGVQSETASHGKTLNQSNELSGEVYELLPDTRASQAESRHNLPMETVG